jgi:intein/homing endonuclease
LIEIEDVDNKKIIKCTPDHKIYTKNRGYVKAKDLKENDELDLI